MVATKKNRGALVPASRDAVVVPPSLSEEFDRFANQYEQSAAGLSGAGWGFISTRGAAFHYREQELENPLKVVILGFSHEFSYYTSAYDPDSMSAPACTAIGPVKMALAPPENWPTKEAEKCHECWANAWGSSPRGRGKACSERVRLCVIPMYPGVNIEKEEGARLRVPTTSLKAFDRLLNEVRALNEGKLAIHGYLTTIELERDPNVVFKMNFKLIKALPEPMMKPILAKVKECQTPLFQVFDPASTVEESGETKPKRGGRGGRARR